MLTDLGADVIKVEPPSGDLLRAYQPRRNGIAVYFAQQNIGKRNVCVDLSKPEGVGIVRALAARSDVLLENFRPGVMERMGLGYPTLAAANPGLVYASISGFGAQSPESRRRAYANVIHARTGLLEREARNGTRPVQPLGFNAADTYSGLQALIALLAALHQRARTGRGQQVEIAMFDTILAVDDAAVYVANGVETLDPPGDAVFDVAGESLFVAGAVGLAARLLFEAMGMPSLRDDPRFATPAAVRVHRDELHALVAAWLGCFPDVASAEHALDTAGIASSRVYSTAEALRLPEVAARGMLVAVDDRGGGTLYVTNSPYRFSDAESGVHGVAASRGEHNRDVLRELLGYDDDRIDALEGAGVLVSRRPNAAASSE
jgi:crotonobetainyl-CoA:carnitine CoA-transferase CaiB-like acyl-CoA transferase